MDWLRFTIGRRAADREMLAEMSEHLERATERFVARGMSPNDARFAARREFGNLAVIQEESRDARGGRMLEEVAQDVRYAIRVLRKSPTFAVVATLTLGLGIGAATAIYTVVDGVLLEPLSYERPDRLVSLDVSPLGLAPTRRVMSPEEYFVFRDESRVFLDIGIYAETDADRDVTVSGVAEPERVHALYVSDGILPLLGVKPAIGRVFSRADDTPSAPPTVVLSHAYWERHFGRGRPAIGTAITIDGTAREIIGVMPQDFQFLDARNVMLVLPLQLNRPTTFQGAFSFSGIGRLRDGATLAEATSEVARMLPMTYRAFPPGPGVSPDIFQKLRLAPNLAPLKDAIIGNVGRVLWVLMASMGIVLLIACANVADLLLVRTAAREQELALRGALGAKHGRIVRQLLTESALLGSVGGVIGIGLAWMAVRTVVRLAPPGLPRIANVSINASTISFAFATALMTSLVFGLIPVLKQLPMARDILSGSRAATASREQRRLQDALAIVQVVLAAVLLVSSGLMVRTFVALGRDNPGYVPADVQTFRIAISVLDISDDAAVLRHEQDLQRQLEAIPGVSGVALGSAVPMDGVRAPQDNVLADTPGAMRQPVPPPRRDVFVSPGYMQTLRIPFIAGRDFNWTETRDRMPVAIVSESFAREYWTTPADALGKRIRPAWGSEWREVVGVVVDVRADGADKPAGSAVYWPLVANARNGTRVTRNVTFAVRSPLAGSAGLTESIRRAVQSVDAKLPLAGVQTLSRLYARSLSRISFALVLLAGAAVIALMLGAIGLYGIVSYSVSQRIREIGVRVALGSSPQRIVTIMTARVGRVIIVGLVVGVVAALGFSRLLSSMLFGVRATDPVTYAIVVALVAVVGAVAAYLPARRAATVDPIIALRHQ